MAEEASFEYVAIDARGRRVRGRVASFSEAGAFERLRRDGFSPVRLTLARNQVRSASRRSLTDSENAEILSSLADLLKAGADMRTALGILASKSARPAIKALCRGLIADVGGGEALDVAFSRHLGRDQAFIAAMVAAGEAAGDLPGGFQRAADMIEARIKLRDQLTSVLAYPTFVLISTIVAVAVILLFVVPSLAPLAEDAGADPPLTLKLLIAASNGVRGNLPWLIGGLAAIGVALMVSVRTGLLSDLWDRVLLNGPTRATTSALIYGGFAVALGNMLAAGASMSDALRLAVRSVRSKSARERLAPVAQAVRQGRSLSAALETIRGFPSAVVRLAAVGEASGALGPMLARAGRLEEAAAVRRIEAVGRLLGPGLIVLLGGLIGLLMAGLLSSVSQLGQAALQ